MINEIAVLSAGRGEGIKAVIEMEKEKIKVVYRGWQEDGEGGKFMLVNEVIGHSTVTYNERLHILVTRED